MWMEAGQWQVGWAGRCLVSPLPWVGVWAGAGGFKGVQYLIALGRMCVQELVG